MYFYGTGGLCAEDLSKTGALPPSLSRAFSHRERVRDGGPSDFSLQSGGRARCAVMFTERP
jgi:hypothetical protein